MIVIKTLIVDDAPYLRDLLKLQLAGTTYEVVGEAHDGAQAIELAAALQPELIILDIGMPIMDGLTALPILKRVAPDARIVVLTGTEPEFRSQALAQGASAVFDKNDVPDIVNRLGA